MNNLPLARIAVVVWIVYELQAGRHESWPWAIGALAFMQFCAWCAERRNEKPKASVTPLKVHSGGAEGFHDR